MSYTYLQEQEEAFSEVYCWDTDPCALLKSSPIAEKCCSNGNGMECCPDFQSGTTSELLMPDHGAGVSMSFAAGFPARTLALLDSAPESEESGADSGEKWREWFAKWDRATSSWKTPQLSLFADFGEFSVIWPRWGMMRSGECFPLRMPSGLVELRALITSESASGFSLPTPTASMFTEADMKQAKYSGSDPRRPSYSEAKRMPTLHGFSKDGKSNGPSGNELGRAVNRMQTPVKDDAVNRKYGKFNSRGEPKLSAQVKRMPSIRKTDAERGGRGDLIQAVRGNENKHFKSVPTPTKSDGTGGPGRSEGRMGGDNLRTEVGGSLNPEWVEWLMGWPIGWTDLQPLETDKFPYAPHSLGRSFQEWLEINCSTLETIF